MDALYEKVREDARVESMAVVIATGVNEQGRREVLGFDVIRTESEEGFAMRENTDHAGPAANLPIQPFLRIGGRNPRPVRGRIM